MNTVTIAAVGDILMWKPQIDSAKITETNYNFDTVFKEVAPYLKDADLTIGNLETTLSGKKSPYFQRNPKTKYPMFNCPDELAHTLKKVGFDVLTTANNHCMDCGIDGLKRTLNVLDKVGIQHTGTFRTFKEAKEDLIVRVKGINFGILAYTYGTNLIPVPKDEMWAVNRIRISKMLKDLKRIKKKSDITIVAVHFGREFHRYPSEKQKEVVKVLLANGADIILGCHPHVLQPIYFYKKKRNGKGNPNQFVIYSMGNFISQKMWKNDHTLQSLILNLKVTKDEHGNVEVRSYSYIPTLVQDRKIKGPGRFRVLPVKKFRDNPDRLISNEDMEMLKKTWLNVTSHMGKGKPLLMKENKKAEKQIEKQIDKKTDKTTDKKKDKTIVKKRGLDKKSNNNSDKKPDNTVDKTIKNTIENTVE